jgi:hypothetical protein
MPKDEKEPVEDKIETKEDEEKIEEKQEEKEEFLSPGIDAPSKGVLDKIASIFKGKPKEETEETKETDDTEDAEADKETKETDESDEAEDKGEESYDEIDPRFISAAREYGWDDEHIIRYAEGHTDAEVLEMVGLFEKTLGKAELKLERTEEPIKEELFSEEELSKYAEAFDVDKDTLKGMLTTMTKPLAENLNNVSSELETIKGSLGKKEEFEHIKEEARNVEVANTIFDKSEISSLGETKDIAKYPDGSYVINDPIFQERSKVWDVAKAFHASGGTFEQAMKNAMQWYKGSSAEKDVKRKVIKDLKEREERVMPKRTEQQGVETYASEEDRKAALINDAVAKYNKEFPS